MFVFIYTFTAIVSKNKIRFQCIYSKIRPDRPVYQHNINNIFNQSNANLLFKLTKTFLIPANSGQQQYKMSHHLAELWAAQWTWSHSDLVLVSLWREREAIIGCQVGDREGDIKRCRENINGGGQR